MQTTARQIRTGDSVTYCGETFVAAGVSYDGTVDLMKVEVSGSFPRFISPFRSVEVVRRVAEKPYVVLTRDYTKTGKKDVRRFTFATKKAQESFMARTKRCVTYYNS